ncbi:TPM domain-containing protein [Planococcus maritimus]|uniref:TPM domain-containing protein n=1 Tax=Planococcus maritimus TaxID=192421 RepID=UPI000B0F23F6|nr:TPM domain-containing protein [Planococcus maritimus]
MKKFSCKLAWMPIVALLLFFISGLSVSAQTGDLIYDEAGLLSGGEAQELEALAEQYGAEQNVDFLFLTTDSTEGQSIEGYMGDFFDARADSTGREDAVLLTIDIGGREVYLAGFGTAEQTLDPERVDLVLDRIIPEMQSGDYADAFEETVVTSSEYMEYRPGVNPESIFLKSWFHLAIAILLAGVIVGSMLYNAGGKVTTTPGTYVDRDHTRVRSQNDRFRNKTVTRRKVPKNKDGGGFGGGGGMTGGGRSFSGGGRSF